MSTLKATQADGYYRPPDFDHNKHGSINKHNGYKGHNQAIKRGIIRLELPHKGLCKSCGRVVDQGTRFNGRKKTVGAYFTTEIYEFTFKCPTCQALLAMRTDPANRDYQYLQNLKLFNSQSKLREREELEKKQDDSKQSPIVIIEKQKAKEMKVSTESKRLKRLIQTKSLYQDDVAANRALRKRMREVRQEYVTRLENSRQLQQSVVLGRVSTIQKRVDESLYYTSKTPYTATSSGQAKSEIILDQNLSKKSKIEINIQEKKVLLQEYYSDSD